MEPKFNIDRPKISDEEINNHKDFDKLVKDFKERSLKQAQGDESWRKNKKVRYSTIIAGVTVICTITLFTLLKTQEKKRITHETLTTPATHTQKTAAARQAVVKAPSEKLKIPYSSYRVNGATGGSITHHSATKIKVPANSFVNKLGEGITGEVTIEYREFHDPADIVVSGIPMAYDSAGTKYNLESAGMFDIRGYHNGEPVFIKPEKKLEVNLSSANAENRFNQYYLDTVVGNWQYIKKDRAMPVTAKAVDGSVSKRNAYPAAATESSKKMTALKTQIETILPRRVDSVQVVYAHKAAQLPRPSEPLKPAAPTKGRPTFKLDGSYNEFPELSAFDNVIFEVGPENTNYTKEFHSITWSDARISQGPAKGRNYYLNLVYRNRHERLVVYPVLTGNDLDRAQDIYSEKLQQYGQLVEKRQADEKRLMEELKAKQQAYLAELKKKQEEYDREKALMAAKYNMDQQNELSNNFGAMTNSNRASRLFSISRFGIYNSDCPHAAPQANAVSNPMFVANGSQINPDFIYLVDHTTRSVYHITAQSGYRLSYVPGNNYSICVFNKNRLFLCGKEAFNDAIARGDRRFPITALPQESESLVDFKKALEI